MSPLTLSIWCTNVLSTKDPATGKIEKLCPFLTIPAVSDLTTLSGSALKLFYLLYKLAHEHSAVVIELPAPVRDTRVDPAAAEPAETRAYSFEQVQSLLGVLPEPGKTAFAVAAFSGLRSGEIEGLRWEDWHDGQVYISRSVWNGRIGPCKTRKSAQPIPVIRQLSERLELHRLRSGNPTVGPIFANSLNKPLAMNNLLRRTILPALNRCVHCGRSKGLPHVREDHIYERDPCLPQWLGWHAARRGLSSYLYRMGVLPAVVQRILRHSNVSTTMDHYVLTAPDDVLAAMRGLEMAMPENRQSELMDTIRDTKPVPSVPSESVN